MEQRRHGQIAEVPPVIQEARAPHAAAPRSGRPQQRRSLAQRSPSERQRGVSFEDKSRLAIAQATFNQSPHIPVPRAIAPRTPAKATLVKKARA